MFDRQEIPHREDDATFRADLDRAMMTAFCRALESSRVTPMTVLSAMAEAFGSVYRQVADSHDNGECRCGWEPARAQDLAQLESMFRKATTSPSDLRLSTMRVAGRA